MRDQRRSIPKEKLIAEINRRFAVGVQHVLQDIQDLFDRAEDPFELGDPYLLVSDQALEGLYQGRDQLQLPLRLNDEVM